jgi:hypothetical protein
MPEIKGQLKAVYICLKILNVGYYFRLQEIFSTFGENVQELCVTKLTSYAGVRMLSGEWFLFYEQLI